MNGLCDLWAPPHSRRTMKSRGDNALFSNVVWGYAERTKSNRASLRGKQNRVIVGFNMKGSNGRYVVSAGLEGDADF